MAEKGVQIDAEILTCAICLDFLMNPVTIPCGHSYCMKCIERCWNGKKMISCPQCRQTFTPRPVLVKNNMLAALVEEMKKSGVQAAPAGAEDVACDVCTGRKLKAVKSCLVCLVSYCESHIQPQYHVAQLKKHQLLGPSKNLHEHVCSRHDEVKKMFCLTDQQSICCVCMVDEHKGHDIVSATAEATEKKKKLKGSRQEIHHKIQEREKDVKLLEQQLETINHSADKTVEDSEKIFTQLIHLIQKRSSDVKQQIRSQQKTEGSRVKELQEKLEQEIRELKKKDMELEQLSHTEDPNQFLLSYTALSALSEPGASEKILVRPLGYFEDVSAAVSELREKLQDVLKDRGGLSKGLCPALPIKKYSNPTPDMGSLTGWARGSCHIATKACPPLPKERNISRSVCKVDVLLSEPKTRADFLRYYCDLTLDPDTAHTQLLLSEGNRKIKLMTQNQFNPSPVRFSSHQILSKESLPERCYWEVQWGGQGGYVAVSYRNVSRTQDGFGCNDASWALFCYPNSCKFIHNKVETSVSGSECSTVGVYLNQRAGFLSFYDVSKNMTLLHKVQTTFTKPLYAGLRLYFNYRNTAELLKLK